MNNGESTTENQPDMKSGYTFYLDVSSFGNVNDTELLSWLEVVNSMLHDSTHEEQYVRPECELYETVTASGNSLSQIVYTPGTYNSGLDSMVRYINRRIAPKNHWFASPSEMQEIYSYTHNAFIGVGYADEIKTDCHLTSLGDKTDFLEKYTIVKPKPDFWEARAVLFPRLHFLKVDEKIITGGTYRNLFEKLFPAIEKFCREDWTSGGFNLNDFCVSCVVTATGESKSVKQNKDKRREREYVIPDYGKQYCPIHIKNGGLRIYIWPCEDKREIYILEVCTNHKSTKRF